MDLTVARDRMVGTQIEVPGVRDDRVLDAVRAVPRHPFVPDSLRAESVYRPALPIGEGQAISQRFIVHS